jgi:hypothetical protein
VLGLFGGSWWVLISSLFSELRDPSYALVRARTPRNTASYTPSRLVGEGTAPVVNFRFGAVAGRESFPLLQSSAPPCRTIARHKGIRVRLEGRPRGVRQSASQDQVGLRAGKLGAPAIAEAARGANGAVKGRRRRRAQRTRP